MISLLGDVQLGHKNQPLRYPLVICYIAIEHGDLQWIYPLKIVIFQSKMLVYQRVLSH